MTTPMKEIVRTNEGFTEIEWNPTQLMCESGGLRFEMDLPRINPFQPIVDPVHIQMFSPMPTWRGQKPEPHGMYKSLVLIPIEINHLTAHYYSNEKDLIEKDLAHHNYIIVCVVGHRGDKTLAYNQVRVGFIQSRFTAYVDKYMDGFESYR